MQQITQSHQPKKHEATPPFDPCWDTPTSAAYIGMKPGTMEVWRVSGRGPRYIKYGRNGAVRYRKSDLDAWIAEQTRQHTSQE